MPRNDHGSAVSCAIRTCCPARDKRVELPREARAEITLLLAEHVEAVHGLLPPRYGLPLLVLDATGMRLGELEGLTWGDVDEQRGRLRVSRAVSKTSPARWVNVPPVLFEAVMALVPGDDRVPERQVQDRDYARLHRLRCAGVFAARLAAPADSLLHLSGVPSARIGEQVGQRNLAVTANTYTHVLADETERNYTIALG
jgi:integrase